MVRVGYINAVITQALKPPTQSVSEKTAVTEMCGDTVKNSWKLVKLYTVNQAEQKQRSGLINCIGEQVTFMRLLFKYYAGIAQSGESGGLISRVVKNP